MNAQFNSQSIEYTRKHDKSFLKKNGIFFTPKSHRKFLLEKINKYIKDNSSILEPSAGSGEFLEDLQTYKFTCLDAVELNEDLYENIKDMDNCSVIHDDFLTRDFQNNII